MKATSLTIRIGGELYDFERPWVMGIINVTPDSFYARSRLVGEEMGVDIRSRVSDMVEKMLDSGADCVDIGGYSTRPGCVDVPLEEEYTRLRMGLKGAREAGGDSLIISVDTFRSEIARRCVDEFGVQIINDIGGGILDSQMYSVVGKLKTAYILMHMRGTPETMSNFTNYEDITRDVISDLMFKVDCLHSAGVADVILDPGFGFAKSTAQNFHLLGELEEFCKTGLPVLVGLSRKSMIWKTLATSPEKSLNGTIALNMAALMKGASILRVHDVAQAKECVDLFMKIKNKD